MVTLRDPKKALQIKYSQMQHFGITMADDRPIQHAHTSKISLTEFAFV